MFKYFSYFFAYVWCHLLLASHLTLFFGGGLLFQSVQHENTYRNPQAKYCYGESPPELLPVWRFRNFLHQLRRHYNFPAMRKTSSNSWTFNRTLAVLYVMLFTLHKCVELFIPFIHDDHWVHVGSTSVHLRISPHLNLLKASNNIFKKKCFM